MIWSETDLDTGFVPRTKRFVFPDIVAARSFPRALDKDPRLFDEHFAGRPVILRSQFSVCDDLFQSPDSESIHPPVTRRQLVAVTAVFDEERLIEIQHRMARGDSKPQVIIFTGRQAFIESAHGIQEASPDQHRGRRNRAQRQTVRKNPAACFAMFFHRIHADPSADPDLIAVTDLVSGLRREFSGLNLQLPGQPFVVGIEKGDPCAGCDGYPEIPRAAHAPILLTYDFHGRKIASDPLEATVSRSIIHDDDLVGRAGLANYGQQSTTYCGFPVEGRNDCRDAVIFLRTKHKFFCNQVIKRGAQAGVVIQNKFFYSIFPLLSLKTE